MRRTMEMSGKAKEDESPMARLKRLKTKKTIYELKKTKSIVLEWRMGHTPCEEMTKERRGGQSGWKGVVLEAVKVEGFSFWKENKRISKIPKPTIN